MSSEDAGGVTSGARAGRGVGAPVEAPMPAKAGRGSDDSDRPATLGYRDAHGPVGDQLAEPAAVLGGFLVVIVGSRAFGGEWSTPVDSVLAVAGASILSCAVAWWFRAAKRRRRAVAIAPWLGDHPWCADGGRSRLLSPMRRLMLVVSAGVAAGAIGMTVLGRGGADAILLAGGIASLPFLGFAIAAARPLLVGGVEVRWDEFPMLLGRKHRVRLRPTSVLPGARAFLARLRLVWAPPPRALGLYEVPVRVFEGDWIRLVELPTRDGFVDLTLDLTNAVGSTTLLPDCALHWELVVTGDTPCGTLAATVLLPIYADPAAAAARAAGESAKA